MDIIGEGTFDHTQIVYGLFKVKLVNQECLLLLWSELEVIFKIAVPDLGNFGVESLAN